MESSSSLGKLLRATGVWTVCGGLIVAIYLLHEASKPGLFSRGQISGTTLLMAGAAVFYHTVLGLTAYGVGELLDRGGRP